MSMRELEKIFKGLADLTRLRILNLLLHGELCVCDVQYVLGLLQPNISRHLTYLKNSGLVLDRREGPRMCYRLADPIEGLSKELFAFLRTAFSQNAAFADDSHKLQKAIEDGACNATQWHPYSGLPKDLCNTERKGQ